MLMTEIDEDVELTAAEQEISRELFELMSQEQVRRLIRKLKVVRREKSAVVYLIVKNYTVAFIDLRVSDDVRNL